MSSPAIPSLEGLTNLARRSGVDIRPTLVRVLTDLYVQKAVHTLEEEQHYTELVLRLIEGVDLATRAIVARKLASYPAAPQKIVERLARDMPEVAEPILRHSPRLSSVELLSMIAEFGPRYAAAIAERQPIRDAGETTGEENMPPPSRADAPVLTSAPTESPTVEASPIPAREPRIGDLFFAATSAQRRLILVKLAEIAPQLHRRRWWPKLAPRRIARKPAYAVMLLGPRDRLVARGAAAIRAELAQRGHQP